MSRNCAYGRQHYQVRERISPIPSREEAEDGNRSSYDPHVIKDLVVQAKAQS